MIYVSEAAYSRAFAAGVAAPLDPYSPLTDWVTRIFAKVDATPWTRRSSPSPRGFVFQGCAPVKDAIT